MDSQLISFAAAIAEQTERSESEIEEQLAKLHPNWVRTVGDWNRLTPERRNELGLPLRLISVMDAVLASEVEKAQHCVRTSRALVIEERSSSCLLVRLQSSSTIADVRYADSFASAMAALLPGCTDWQAEGFACDALVMDVFIPGVHVSWKEPNGALVLSRIDANYQLTSVEGWLLANGIGRLSNKFYSSGVRDFLMLPLLRADALTQVLQNEADVDVVASKVSMLRGLPYSELASLLVEFVGVAGSVPGGMKEFFKKEEIDVALILKSNRFDLEFFQFPPEEATELADIMYEYREYSSVQATYDWLLENGFGIYAVQFAKSNIPIYALPLLNYFVVLEMGIVIDDQVLYKRLRELADSPIFTAQSVSFWLRDIEFAGVQHRLGALTWESFQEFAALPNATVTEPIRDNYVIDKFVAGLAELREFIGNCQWTSSILEQLGMERYSELFALHAVSVDMLPLLTDEHLERMGVTSSQERKQTLARIQQLLRHGPVTAASLPMLLTAPASSFQCGLPSPTGQRPALGRDHLPAAGETRSVEEWMRFINNSDEVATSKKKKRKRKKKKRKKKAAAPAQGDVEDAPAPEASVPLVSDSLSKADTSCCPVRDEGPPTGDEGQEALVSQSARRNSPATSNDSSTPVEEKSLRSATEKTLLLAEARESIEGDPREADAREAATEQAHVPLSFETSHLVGLEPIKVRHEPLSPELLFCEDRFNDEFSDEDDMDPELKAQLDAEVEEFRKRLESTHSKSKLSPIFFLPD